MLELEPMALHMISSITELPPSPGSLVWGCFVPSLVIKNMLREDQPEESGGHLCLKSPAARARDCKGLLGNAGDSHQTVGKKPLG